MALVFTSSYLASAFLSSKNRLLVGFLQFDGPGNRFCGMEATVPCLRYGNVKGHGVPGKFTFQVIFAKSIL